MNDILSFITFFISRRDEIGTLFIQHIQITLISVFFAIIIGIPIGLVISRYKLLAKPTLFTVELFQTIPSLAFFGFIIPILGIGLKPAIFVLFLYGLLPIVTNTFIGIKSIDKSILEAGVGMGMDSFDIIKKVEFPLAFPIIMGGIKISTVTNIGTATVAALIGAGGLGEAIFRGISINNNNLILCGAIPTALLAFAANYILGNIEKALKPVESLELKKEKIKSKKIAKFSIALLLFTTSFLFYNNIKDYDAHTIKVGHKAYTEQRILGQLIGILLQENSNYKVEVIELGGSKVTFEALKNNHIDVYPEYTGSLYSNILGEQGMTDPELVYEYVKEQIERKYGLTLLKKLKFSNTYAFVLKQDLATKYSLENITDLGRVANSFLLGGDSEFYEREDGLLGIQKVYGITFPNRIHMDTGLVFTAINSDKVDIAIAYSTDGGIIKYNLKVIEDDQNFFPPYNVAPVVSVKFLEDYPDLTAILNKLENKITEAEMQEMNYLVSEEGKKESEVARDFLIKNNFIE